jgi:hypothetical protein
VPGEMRAGADRAADCRTAGAIGYSLAAVVPAADAFACYPAVVCFVSDSAESTACLAAGEMTSMAGFAIGQAVTGAGSAADLAVRMDDSVTAQAAPPVYPANDQVAAAVCSAVVQSAGAAVDARQVRPCLRWFSLVAAPGGSARVLRVELSRLRSISARTSFPHFSQPEQAQRLGPQPWPEPRRQAVPWLPSEHRRRVLPPVQQSPRALEWPLFR